MEQAWVVRTDVKDRNVDDGGGGNNMERKGRWPMMVAPMVIVVSEIEDLRVASS